MSVPRRVVVKGREGVVATVVVTVYRGDVWMSIVPPFTWEAIMEPAKVDELIQVLGSARQEVRRPAVVARADSGHAELSASTRTGSRRFQGGC
jgi:hypothetical protein